MNEPFPVMSGIAIRPTLATGHCFDKKAFGELAGLAPLLPSAEVFA